MTTHERGITEIELRRNTGERGSRKWIAYAGIVYDVTDCPKWRGDMHECRNLLKQQNISGEYQGA